MTAEKMKVAECKKTVKSTATKELVLAVLFKSSIGTGIGNTFCQSTVIGVNNVFTSIVNNPAA